MKYPKKTYELIKPVVDSLDNVFHADSAQVIDGKTRFNTCDTLWLSPGRTITIGGIDFTINSDFSPNEYFIVDGEVDPLITDFEVYRPKFFHGTVKFTNEELSQIQFGDDKFPMVYLYEILREQFNDDPLLNKERDAEVRMFCLVERNERDWSIEDHEKYAVTPMRNLAFRLKNALQLHPSVMRNTLYEYEVTDLKRWGGGATETGDKTSWFVDLTSGTLIETTIPFTKPNPCQNGDCICCE